ARGLQAQSWPAKVHYDEEHTRAYMEVVSDQLDFLYEIRVREYLRPAFAHPETSETADEDNHYYRAEVFLRRGGLAYDVYCYQDMKLISDILDHFEKYLDFLHLSPGVLPWYMAAHDELLQPPKEICGGRVLT